MCKCPTVGNDGRCGARGIDDDDAIKQGWRGVFTRLGKAGRGGIGRLRGRQPIAWAAERQLKAQHQDTHAQLELPLAQVPVLAQ